MMERKSVCFQQACALAEQFAKQISEHEEKPLTVTVFTVESGGIKAACVRNITIDGLRGEIYGFMKLKAWNAEYRS